MPNCSHMFHRECIDRYIEVTGKDLTKCCPYKCAQAADNNVDESDEGVSVVGTLVIPIAAGGSSSSSSGSGGNGSGSVTIL